MKCDPTVRLEVGNVAVPAERLLLPSRLAPSMKATVPVGAPSGDETGAVKATLAVSVTVAP